MAKPTPRYLYCRTWYSEKQPPEVRRYKVLEELKTKIKLDPTYCVKEGRRWVQAAVTQSTPVQVAILSRYKGHPVLNSSIGDFRRYVPQQWRQGQAAFHAAQEEERKAKGDPDPFQQLWDSLLADRPDWARFGFLSKPSLSEFKRAYRKTCIKLHPDQGGDVEQFKQMQAEAEKCLAVLQKQGNDQPAQC